MGIVRDVTIDQLTQAVQGISSTGISDSTGQAINNTLGTLLADTTGQSIASAISGLGTALGSDKANISGDNIADKATFRRNIEVNKIIVDSFTRSVTIAANSNTAWNAYTESLKDGYVAIGIIQFQTNNQNIVPANLCLDNSSYGIFLRNISGSSQTGSFKYTVLYVKND